LREEIQLKTNYIYTNMGMCIQNRVRNADVFQSGNKAIKISTEFPTTDAAEARGSAPGS